MKKFITKPVCFGLLAAALLQPVLAQVGVGGGIGGRRAQGDGINYAPQAEVYAVISVDADARTVRLRAANGKTGVVQVGESVYDLAKLKAGDKIRVDFVVPDEKDGSLRAASIWPAK
jgi:hypothetical protein